MNESIYEQISRPIRNSKYGVKTLNILNILTTSLVYLTYPIFLLILGYNRDIRFWKIIIIPLVAFVIVSTFRWYINCPRPYEKLDIDPIIKKGTKGKSFPSRHVFSAFTIAMTLYYISKPIGLMLMLTGIVISIIRVLGGVHFPRDVIAGAVIGIISGIVGWYVLVL